MRSSRKGWRGYIFSRQIAGQVIPQRVQNLVVRTYAERLGLLFLLSATEYHMKDSTMMIESLYGDLSSLEGILFYSINMLPAEARARKRLYSEVFSNGAGLRFALEDLALFSPADVPAVEDVLAVRALSRTFLPPELLSPR